VDQRLRKTSAKIFQHTLNLPRYKKRNKNVAERLGLFVSATVEESFQDKARPHAPGLWVVYFSLAALLCLESAGIVAG